MLETEPLQLFLPFSWLGGAQILILCPRLPQDPGLSWPLCLFKAEGMNPLCQGLVG